MATFIGIDLSWKSERNPSGAVVLRGQEDGAALVDVSPPLRSIKAVLGYIEAHTEQPCVVAIDAPLVILNSSGQRTCESEVGRRYGARHASCHTSNQRLYPQAASVQLAEELAHRGYVHAPGLPSPRDARAVMLEVYPHAALVALYDLPRILKYKKGRLAEKRAGLAELQRWLHRLTHHDPPILATEALSQLLDRPVEALGGQARKDYEDSLDALICAYVAFHYWVWNGLRSEVFGDVESGYILNPRLHEQQTQEQLDGDGTTRVGGSQPRLVTA